MPLKTKRAADVLAEKLVKAKIGALGEVAAMIDDAAAMITGPVPKVEVAAWSAKAAQARAILKREGPAPILEEEVAGTEETVLELAEKVVANADAYEEVLARLTRIRREVGRRINAATEIEDIQSVVDFAAEQLQQTG